MGKEEKYIRCKRCNKILKTSEAQNRGYGEHCWYIHLQEQKNKNTLFPMPSTRRK